MLMILFLNLICFMFHLRNFILIMVLYFYDLMITFLDNLTNLFIILLYFVVFLVFFLLYFFLRNYWMLNILSCQNRWIILYLMCNLIGLWYLFRSSFALRNYTSMITWFILIIILIIRFEVRLILFIGRHLSVS
jgi:hypothetical protein